MAHKKITTEKLAAISQEQFLALEKKMATKDDVKLILSAIENVSGQIAEVNITH
jgi:hypothetical protein